jgi:hypothetical protein
MVFFFCWKLTCLIFRKAPFQQPATPSWLCACAAVGIRQPRRTATVGARRDETEAVAPVAPGPRAAPPHLSASKRLMVWKRGTGTARSQSTGCHDERRRPARCSATMPRSVHAAHALDGLCSAAARKADLAIASLRTTTRHDNPFHDPKKLNI